MYNEFHCFIYSSFSLKLLLSFAVPKNEKSQAHVIIGTPGTLLDWLIRHHRFDPRKIAIFVFDEADVMISTQGHQDQSIRIKKFVHFHSFISSSLTLQLLEFSDIDGDDKGVYDDDDDDDDDDC